MDMNPILNAARKRLNLPSDRALARHLKLSAPTLIHYREGRIAPKADTMYSIAEAAGTNPDIAVLDLEASKATGKARATFRRAIAALSRAAAAAAVIFLLATGTDPATAAEHRMNIRSAAGGKVYIMRQMEVAEAIPSRRTAPLPTTNSQAPRFG